MQMDRGNGGFRSAAAVRSNAPTAKKCPWGDPDVKRQRRVAKYKAYGAEGRLKSTIRRGFRWIKLKCSHIVHGF